MVLLPLMTPEKLLKPYDPKETETRIYKLWEESGFFSPEGLPCVDLAKQGKIPEPKPFTIIMPPPNVTGVLHMGHALAITLEDIMIRYKRMQGFKTLWLPGTDHAAIATQSKVETDIKKKEGKSRHDIGREEMLRRINEFARQSHDTIVSQIKIMGASCDWSREAFTLDVKRNLAVNTMFKKMYDDGLIYRGHRIVNWDPKGQTTISDDEIVYEEEKAKFYYLKYGPFTIGTARPETKFGDKYVVMHPEDKRYEEYKHGQKIDLEWINGPITATVIKDKSIDMEFGTGVMTITPWHSNIDFEIAERHSLDKEQIIDKYGKLLPIAGEFTGIKIKDAREKIIKKLNSKGLVEKEKEYTHNIATAERTGGIIEPQIMLQWFVSVNKEIPTKGKTLKDLMREPLQNGDIKIIPDHFSKTYFHWIENLRDWCISRQIWYGHRVPVWYDKNNKPYLFKEQKIILVRHGESEGNVKKIWSGHSDSPLTEKGVNRAKNIAETSLRSENITKIICSDLSRAYDTAKTIKNDLGITCDIESWQDLREVNPGEFTNMATDGTPIMVKAFESKEGESYEKLAERVKNVFEKIKKIETEGTILIVSHNSFLAALSSLIEGKSQKESMINMRTNNALNNAGAREYFLQIPPSPEMTQDEDTLDTWFSSGMWTFSTLGWPNQTEDLKTFHPTDILETGYEILFFWVARMILMSGYALDEVPFKTIYLHGTVRDIKGRKMSKSLGNGIDPLDIADKFGADAARIALVYGSAPGTDMRVDENKIRGYKNFANKIWNMTRFVLENTDLVVGVPLGTPTTKSNELTEEFQALAKDITSDMENYRFHLASEKIYQYIWHKFADVIIEESKNNDEIKKVLLPIWTDCLKILHPFMPFVTEEIWSTIGKSNLLIVEPWPCSAKASQDKSKK